MPVRDSFWARLVQSEVGTPEVVVASIRQAMLDAIDELRGPDVRELDAKVSSATDITELWNLRPDLLTAIATEQGKEAANKRVNVITMMFGKYF